MENDHERYGAAYLLDEMTHRMRRFLLRADRFGMKESVEMRSPFLANNIVMLAHNIPITKRITFGMSRLSLRSMELVKEKNILKGVAKSLNIPKSIIQRQKMGTILAFEEEIHHLLQNFNLKFVPDILEVNQASIREAVLATKHPSNWRIVWGILSIEILMRIFLDGETPHDISDKIQMSRMG